MQRWMEERGLDLVELECASVVPLETCRAAARGERVEVRLLDRMVRALDEYKPLKGNEWAAYLTQTFAIDGWDPDRCYRLLSEAACFKGVAA